MGNVVPLGEYLRRIAHLQNKPLTKTQKGQFTRDYRELIKRRKQ